MSHNQTGLIVFPYERSVDPEDALVFDDLAQVVDLACFALTKTCVTPEESDSIAMRAHEYEKQAYMRCAVEGLSVGPMQAKQLHTASYKQATDDIVSRRPQP